MSIAENRRSQDLLRQQKEARFASGAPKRVALLMRVSTNKQSDDDEVVPIPIQKELLLGFIEQTPGWVPATTASGEILEYTEICSAFKMIRVEREPIENALRDAYNDLYDIILFFKHDRLSRISDEYPSIIKDFWDLGVEPWDFEKKQPLTLKNQMDKLVRYIEGWQSETESVNTSYRVTQFMREYAQEGHWMGGKQPYGYRYKEPEIVQTKGGKNKRRVRMGIEIEPEEAKVVALIFQLYTSGYGSTRICRVLNNPPYNLRKRNGKPFDHTMVLAVIKNPIYIGIVTWGKTSYQNRYFQRIPEDEWVKSNVVEEFKIVENELFLKAQEILEERSNQVKKGKKTSNRTVGSERLLAGIAYCGYCGEPMLSKSYSNPKKNYKRQGYTCRSRKRKSPCEGTRGFWEQSELETIIIKVISDVINEIIELDLNELMNKIHTIYNEEKNSSQKIIVQSIETLKKLKLQQEYYIGQFNLSLSGGDVELPVSVIKEQIKKINNEIDLQTSLVEDLQKKLKNNILNDDLLKELISHMGDWETIFQNADMIVKRNMIEQLVDEIKVFDDRVTINFSFNVYDILSCASSDAEEFRKPMNI